jgi:hypothetical protein
MKTLECILIFDGESSSSMSSFSVTSVKRPHVTFFPFPFHIYYTIGVKKISSVM